MGVPVMASDSPSERAAMIRESLQKSQTIIDRVILILGSFDHCLSALETAMRPTQVRPFSFFLLCYVCLSRKCRWMREIWKFVGFWFWPIWITLFILTPLFLSQQKRKETCGFFVNFCLLFLYSVFLAIEQQILQNVGFCFLSWLWPFCCYWVWFGFGRYRLERILFGKLTRILIKLWKLRRLCWHNLIFPVRLVSLIFRVLLSCKVHLIR